MKGRKNNNKNNIWAILIRVITQALGVHMIIFYTLLICDLILMFFKIPHYSFFFTEDVYRFLSALINNMDILLFFCYMCIFITNACWLLFSEGFNFEYLLRWRRWGHLSFFFYLCLWRCFYYLRRWQLLIVLNIIYGIILSIYW